MTTFDPKCYDLAELFLSDTSYAGNTEIITALAAEIQETIEDFITVREEGEEEEADE